VVSSSLPCRHSCTHLHTDINVSRQTLRLVCQNVLMHFFQPVQHILQVQAINGLRFGNWTGFLSQLVLIFRPHHSTVYADVAQCNRHGDVVCPSVTNVSPAKTNQDAIWVLDSVRPKEPCIRWGSRSPLHMGNSEGGKGMTHCIVQGLSTTSGSKTAVPIEMLIGM